MSHDATDDRFAKARLLCEQARAAETSGQCELADQLFDEAIRLLDKPPHNELLADALRWKGTSRRDRGETHEASDLYQRSIEVARASGARSAEAHALNCLAIVAQRRGDFQSAEVLYDRAATLGIMLQDHQLLGMIGQNRSVIAKIRRDPREALDRYAESLRSFEITTNQLAITSVLNHPPK